MKRRKIIFIVSGAVLLCVALALLIFFISSSGGASDSSGKGEYKSYTITFDIGNETNTVAKSNTKTGKISQPEPPSRTGYTFVGWFTSLDHDDAYDFNTVVDHDFTLYAKWAENQNKIKFEGNGSTSGSMEEIQAETESVIKLPQNRFKRIGYTFAGWSDIANGTVKNLDGGWFYMEDSETVVLFAVWKANEYAVTLDVQNGTSDVTDVVSTYDSVLPTVNKPTRAGFAFAGYFTQTDGNGDKYYDSNMIGTKLYRLTTAITLYAYWVVADNTLMFAGNGATSGATAEIDTVTLAEVVLPDSGFKRIGYTFAGWNTRADGSGDSYDVGESYVVPAKAEAVTLYAIWLANKYTVVFNDNYSAAKVSETHTYDEIKQLADNTFVRYGYNFVGWNDSENGSGNYYQDGQAVLNLTDEVDAEVVFYAVWTPVNVTVVFDKGGGIGGTNYVDVTYGDDFPRAVAPTKVGYSFGGYYKNADGTGIKYYDDKMTSLCVSNIGEKNTLYAKWIANFNTLVLEPNGGNDTAIQIDTKTDAVILLGDYSIERVGYTLSGWSTLPKGTVADFASDCKYTVPASDSIISLYAVWENNALSVEFNGNDSTAGATNSINGVCDGDVTLPDSGYEKLGYKFVGWSPIKNGGQIYAAGSIYTLPAVDEESVELFAQWELVSYKITYRLDDGNNSINNPSEYNYLSANITLHNPSRLGFTFTGWEEGNSIPTNSVGDKTFTAIWEVIHYNIIYVLNATGVTNNNVNSYTVLDEIVLKDPSHGTKKFEGWVEGNMIAKGSTGDKTFTAQWNDPTYLISYNLDGGQNGIGNPGSYTAYSPTITLSAPTKKGYVFTGWTSEDMGISTPTNTVVIPTGSNGDKTFNAHWDIVTYNIFYVLNGGVNSIENPTAYNINSGEILLDDPTRDGYTFDGWQEGAVIEEDSVGDLTFTAVWTAIRYNINIFDGVNEEPEIIHYTIESETVVVAMYEDTETGLSFTISIGTDSSIISIVHRGYRLLGWYEAGDDSVVNTIITVPTGTTGNLYFVAKWDVIEYSITYNLADGEIGQGENPEKYTVEDDAIILKNPTRKGYDFAGWKNSDGDIVNMIFTGNGGNITLQATWQIIEYTITYDLGDDTAINDSDNPDKYTVEDEDIVLREPTRDGYVFLRWEDKDGNAIYSIPHGSIGNITIKAKWTLITP